jgi:hypothetical protein
MSISLQRYPVFDVATPLKDLLFFEVVDYNLQANRNMSYGDAHHDVAKYPHHVLVYITPADKEGKFYRFYYAAKRENQDQYNWESAPTQIGGITVDSVSRTYIIPRSEFNVSSPAIGSAMPDVPSGKFGTGWKLFNVIQGRTSEPELDSIYVVVKRIYVKDTQAIGKEYGKIVTEDIQINTLVPENTQPDTGIEILSSQVTPIGNGLATKETRSVTGGVWPDPIEKQVSKSRENLIPQKFRSFITRLLTSRKVANVPDSVTLGGNVVGKEYVRETPDRVDEKIIEEILDENVEDLEGEQYGKIVTVSTFEKLVEEGTPAETGINVMSSTVTPLGNGKSIKQDEIVKGGWPNPVEKQISKTRDNLIPQKFRNFVTRLMVSRKVTNTPEFIILTGDEIGKEYVKETPDRVDEKVTTETIDENVEPLTGESYGKIVTVETEETLVEEGTPAETGIAILTSTVTPLGNGKAIKATEKVKGGVWPDPVTRGLQRVRDNLIPQKFRNFVVRTTTSRKVSSAPESITLSGDVVAKNYIRETPDRFEEETVTETVDENVTPLSGKQVVTNFGGGVADTIESLVNEVGEVTGGFNVVSESVTPLGNGKFIREKVSVEDAWPVLQGSKYDPDLNISFSFTDEVRPANAGGGQGIDVDPLDKWRSKVRTQNVSEIVEQLADIHVILPTQQNIQLPNTLQSVKVIVSRTLGNGNSVSMGSSFSLGMDSAVSVSADLTWQVKEGYSGPVDAEIHVFYMPLGGVTAEDIQTKVGAQPWPQYAPVSHRLVITGHGVTKSYDSRRSADGFSMSESSTVTALTNSAILPQCINDQIDVQIEYIDLVAPTSGIDEAIDAAVAAHTAKVEAQIAEVESGFYLGIPITASQSTVLKQRLEFNLSEARFVGDLVLADFPVKVRPATISPTSPAAIVEGKYVYSANVQQYAYGMVRVTAVVVNLTGV